MKLKWFLYFRFIVFNIMQISYGKTNCTASPTNTLRVDITTRSVRY